MKKYFVLLLSFTFLFSLTSPSLAQTTRASTTTTSVSVSSTTDILTQIKELLALITSLQTQLDTLKAEQAKVSQELGTDAQVTVTPSSSQGTGSSVSSGTGGTPASSPTQPLPTIPVFTRILTRGASGNDVRELQLFLKSLP
ncbi:MAG: hypothetical protein Greene101415_1060, partial [Parcubacteria group bacterium Greene1014_15]